MKNEFLKMRMLFDGAMGTELQRRGLPQGFLPELWNLEKPEIVEEIHKDYILSGAMVIETNTFGGNRMRLRRAKLEERIEEINKRGVEIALKASKGKTLVAGSVGPLGELIEPYGDLSEEEAEEIFSEQIYILKNAGVNFILIETMTSLIEAKIALKSAKKLGCIVGVTMSFEVGKNGIKTFWGDDVITCLKELEKEGADFIGSNCGKGFYEMSEVAKVIRANTRLPVLIQPNAGIPKIINNKLVYPESPIEFAKFVTEMLNININFVGGCCGTTPEFIKEAKKIFEKIL
jgi:5-methyltetrahydrofolate--homocysteine methyltransferase